MMGGDSGSGWVFLLVIVAIAGAIVLGAYANRKRREALLAFATSIGWTYQSNARQL
ncbi:MAG: hypothetical protein GX593_14950, partial [Actinomycetales bacterium]|nr:hypothetical protein [Actinomycetales bacterium]